MSLISEFSKKKDSVLVIFRLVCYDFSMSFTLYEDGQDKVFQNLPESFRDCKLVPVLFLKMKIW